ncbi:MAG: FKBP-type peptidyl-prolyl cis-trans isomerase [Parasporobacterium sp.]|nr:FKBP-type peptidyl-prolyl cis-trans isomerase [Parasporobacterium sp.]
MDENKDLELKETVEESTETVAEAVENAAEEAAQVVEEVKEEAPAEEFTCENGVCMIKPAEESAEDASEEEAGEEAVEEAAEETSEEAEETTAEEVEETEAEEAEEEPTSEEVEETAEAEADDSYLKGLAEAEAPVKAEKAKKEAPVIKKKKKVNTTALISVIICVVVVIACLLFVGFKEGWFTFLEYHPKNEMTMGDYSTIEVLKSSVDITDETVDSYVESLLNSQAVTNQVTEGTVAEGDTVNIDYKGIYRDNEMPFDGGTAEGQNLTIGSGQFIDGFESGLIGKNIGDTVRLELTFPEDYSSEELAGVDVYFDVTINYKNETIVPELTDAWVAENSKNLLGEEIKTAADLRTYYHDRLYENALYQGMLNHLQALQTVKSYDEEWEARLKNYSLTTLQTYASYSGVDADTYASYYGYPNADAYTTEEAHYYLDIAMLMDYIIADKGIEWTEEELNEEMAKYLDQQGVAETYTVEEYKQLVGEDWVYLYTNLEFKFNKVMKALEPQVIFVDKLSYLPEEETTEDISSIGENTTEATPVEESAAN